MANPAIPATQLRQQGITIIAIGIPDYEGLVNKIKREELVEITGDEKLVHIKNRFEDALGDAFIQQVRDEACPE